MAGKSIERLYCYSKQNALRIFLLPIKNSPPPRRMAALLNSVEFHAFPLSYI